MSVMPSPTRSTARPLATREAGSTRARGVRVLGALSLVGLSWLLPACSGCGVELERSSTAPGVGLFRGLVVGGTKPDGAFVVALREGAPDRLEATVVTLGDDPRMCSLGPAIWYDTVRQGAMLGVDGELVYDRPGRIVAVEGAAGDTSGTLRVFDASCELVLEGPRVELPVRQWLGADYKPGAYLARSVGGSLLWIDPWAPSIRILGEQVSSHGHVGSMTFWLVEEGALVVRDIEGKTLASVGSGVTEVASAGDGTELAFVDEGGLFVMSLADQTPVPVATEGAPCKPKYLSLPEPTLTYREDCAVGALSLLDRSTGEKQIFSNAVTDVHSIYVSDGPWVFFLREPAGGERELWVIHEGSEPVLVGEGPDPVLYKIGRGDHHDFFVLLGEDGGIGTLGRWTPDGGFEPLLAGVGWSIGVNGYLMAVAEREGDVGALRVLDLDTLDSVLRVEGVPWTTVRSSRQAPALGYIRGWDGALGAGTFEVWIEPTGEQVVVDEGVSEYQELLWPEPGAIYAVRTPGREGLWTVYPGL